MQTYLFYDIETTGLSKAFDQVLQFAAIRTDMQLREIKRYEIKVKLNADIVPAPAAIMTHHIGIKDAQQGMPEIDAIKLIHGWMNESGTLSLGYNTLGFDDEFLRFSFYRNLLPPYTHQFANQCGRMDIFPMAIMYFLFKKAVLEWPEKEGRLSLKLEALNEANQLFKGRAHDAMVDVEATLGLAKLFFKEEKMWEYVSGYFNKQIDQSRSQHQDALMVNSKFGYDYSFQAPVLFLGQHRHYKNQQLWLRLDSVTINNPTLETIQDYKQIANKKLGEPGFILPHADRFLKHLTAERHHAAQTNKKWLEQNGETLQQIINYHAEFKFTVYPETDPEAGLYINGFWSNDETIFCTRFHAAAPKEKAIMVEHLRSSPLKTLATRLLGRHYPEVMTSAQSEYFSEFLLKTRSREAKQGLIDHSGTQRLLPHVALEEIATIRQKTPLTETQLSLLTELENYLLSK